MWAGVREKKEKKNKGKERKGGVLVGWAVWEIRVCNGDFNW